MGALKKIFITNRLGYVSLSLIGSALVVIVFLSVFGLERIIDEAGGVYADCSKAQNRNNKFCNRNYKYSDDSSSKETFRGQIQKDNVPFNLY